MNELIELILHADDALLDLVARYGTLTYLIVAFIIFSETGFVVTPFLPGDGLIFSAGVIAGTGSLDIVVLVPVLIGAAILGNITNFYIGRFTGNRLDRIKSKRFHNYLNRAHEFYQKHGQKAIIICRFFPILRTYVPFVAGVAHMTWSRYLVSTVLGAFLWVIVFSISGYFLGEIPWVKENFGFIVIGLIIVTLIPFGLAVLKEILRSVRKKRAAVTGEEPK